MIDKSMMKNSKRRKTSLSMVWIDYKKAFNIISHSFLMECLQICSIEENTINFFKNTVPKWKAILTSEGKG